MLNSSPRLHVVEGVCETWNSRVWRRFTEFDQFWIPDRISVGRFHKNIKWERKIKRGGGLGVGGWKRGWSDRAIEITAKSQGIVYRLSVNFQNGINSLYSDTGKSAATRFPIPQCPLQIYTTRKKERKKEMKRKERKQSQAKPSQAKLGGKQM